MPTTIYEPLSHAEMLNLIANAIKRGETGDLSLSLGFRAALFENELKKPTGGSEDIYLLLLQDALRFRRPFTYKMKNANMNFSRRRISACSIGSSWSWAREFQHKRDRYNHAKHHADGDVYRQVLLDIILLSTLRNGGVHLGRDRVGEYYDNVEVSNQ